MNRIYATGELVGSKTKLESILKNIGKRLYNDPFLQNVFLNKMTDSLILDGTYSRIKKETIDCRILGLNKGIIEKIIAFCNKLIPVKQNSKILDNKFKEEVKACDDKTHYTLTQISEIKTVRLDRNYKKNSYRS